MNRNALILAAIFLVIGLVLPMYTIIEDYGANVQSIISILQKSPDATALTALAQQMQAKQTILAVLVSAEALFVVLFAVSLWFAFRHPVEKHLEHSVPVSG